MFKRIIAPIFLMVASLALLAFCSVKFIQAAAYTQIGGGGWQINVNQGIANFTAQTRAISIDTSLATTSFFVPDNAIDQVDSYIASPLHAIVQYGGDVTPPTFTLEATYDYQPGALLAFHLNEDGYYRTAWSTSGYPGDPMTTWLGPISANYSASFNVGDAYSTFYYWKAFYKDTTGNTASTSGTLTTGADHTAPIITAVDSPHLSGSPPAYEQTFMINENGYYAYQWSTVPIMPALQITSPLNANTTQTISIGDTANTGYYYEFDARDASPAHNTSTPYTNYVVTTVGSAPVLSNISDKTPGGSPPASDIMFDSDMAGHYQIVYSDDFRTLPPANPHDTTMMQHGFNRGTAGDGTINTNFYYIIYAWDQSMTNSSDSGVLTVGSPSAGGDITLGEINAPSRDKPPGSDVLFFSTIDDGGYEMVYNKDGDFSVSDNNFHNYEPMTSKNINGNNVTVG
ncbi:MAG: hypothetical protein NTX66_03910, partial [Candidatus Falkowbacteria bacterium]|nr:hypothetical protein [Candidatus Falkowbacteria bacterium]